MQKITLASAFLITSLVGTVVQASTLMEYDFKNEATVQTLGLEEVTEGKDVALELLGCTEETGAHQGFGECEFVIEGDTTGTVYSTFVNAYEPRFMPAVKKQK